MKRPPSIVVLVPLRGPATVLLLADSLEDQERIRQAIIRRGDLIPTVAIAVAELLEALDEAAGEDVAA